MATKAFQKIYTKITQITKATCSLKATGVGYDELATVNGKLAQVVKIAGDDVTLQVFEGTEGIPTNAEVVFLGKAPTIKVSDQLAGRFFNAFGDPIDGGPSIEGQEVEIGGPSVNPVRRKQPSELIATSRLRFATVWTLGSIHCSHFDRQGYSLGYIPCRSG